MKKFMKAIAFVTVMCMALSTVAFATVSPVLRENEKVLDITVTGAGNDQVALLVVAENAEDFNTPLYIDQKGAVDGIVEFEAVLTNVTAEKVDIYVGYASLGADSPAKVGSVPLTKPITKASVEMVDSGWLDKDDEDLKGKQQIGGGVWADFNVVVPDGVSATNMIWAIRYNDAEGKPKVKYSDPVANFVDYNIGSIVKGSVTLGLAFLNGFDELKSDINDIAPVQITRVDAIFLFSDGDEVFTNDDDKKPEN